MRAVVALAVLAALARAEIRPSFDLDSLTWRATHIVVVRTNGADGKVEVIESLHGDLAPGETLPLGALAFFHGELVELRGQAPRPARAQAREILATCKGAAVQVLRGILADPLRRSSHYAAIEALAPIDAPGVGAVLTEVVERQLELWRRVAPGLQEGWWSAPGDRARARELQNEFHVTYAALHALAPLRHEPCRESVAALRDFWRAHPQLPDQVIRAADAVLSSLPAK